MSARIGLVLWLLAAAVCAAFAVFGDALSPVVYIAALGVIVAAALARDGTAGRVLRLIRVELTKLWRNRIFGFGIAATALITLLAAWVHEPLDGETGWAVAAGSIGTGFWCAEVFLLVLGATSIAGELGQGTLKMILPHAYKRSEWIAAKAVVLIVAAGLFAAAASLVGTAHAAATLGLGDVVKEIPAGFGEEEGSVEVFQAAGVMRSHLV